MKFGALYNKGNFEDASLLPNQELRWKLTFTEESGRCTFIVIGKAHNRKALIGI